MLLVTGLALTGFFRQATLKQFEAGLTDLSDGLLSKTNVNDDGSLAEPPFIDLRSTRTYSGRYWAIAEPKPGGVRVLMRSRSLAGKDIPMPADGVDLLARRLGEPVFYDARGPDGEHLRVATSMSLMPKRTEPVIFMVAQDRKAMDASARNFATLAASTLVALGFGLVVAVLLQVRVGLQPLFALGREIAEVRKGNRLRLSERYPKEVAPLAEEMNALLDHNQEVVERQRTHVGNLAHALKTPLAVLTGEAERHPGELGALVAAQAGVMRGQVDHHLRRARAAARSQSAGERTQVEPALDELAVMLERVFQDKGVEIDWRAPDDLCFRGERQDFLEVAGNLLENACLWCKRRVRVTAAPGAGPVLTLSVEDDGPGLPEDRRDEVLKRGARLDESAPGSGLGLSIVDELARAYGGKVVLGASSMGGLKVDVDLPSAET